MRAFTCLNPITQAIWFAAAALCVMFSLNPVTAVISLAGASAFFVYLRKSRDMKSHLYFILLWLLITAVNPLVSHNGSTVLFIINNEPFTMEALIYGAVSATAVLGVLYIFRVFSQIMSSDRLMYLFGKLSPKLSLVLSMTLRFTSLFAEQTKKVQQSQRATGLYKEDNIIDSIHGRIRVFSIMLSWALENGIITADSMAARGYGTGRRTHFARYSFKAYDIIFIIISLLFGCVTLFSEFKGAVRIEFYPHFIMNNTGILAAAGYISYGILAFLPMITEIVENIKWKCYLLEI